MMRESDVLVIGGGLAGLISAAAAAQNGKKVMLLSQGAGTLTIGGGIIDILGYSDDAQLVKSPLESTAALSAGHPYGKIGTKTITEALDFFLKICEEEGYPQIGNADELRWIPTAAGTLKPTCVVPMTMNVDCFKTSVDRVIVGFKYLKDFYPELVAKNLAQMPGYQGDYQTVMVSPSFEGGRDVSTLDIARWLDTEEGFTECVRQLSGLISPGSTLVMPPVLGTNPDYDLFERMKQQLNCELIETVAVPPSITGLRLRQLLLNYVKKHGVKIIEQAFVTKSIVESGRCKAVVTESFDRERSYHSKSFILATGGIYGGGIVVEPDRVFEPIFGLPVKVPYEREQWGNSELFSRQKQPFAQIGIEVDEYMRPVDEKGNIIFPNVYVAGRNLAGYDYCFEKSGNGVALSSGYKAAMSV